MASTWEYKPYEESEDVKKYRDMYTQYREQKPADYQSQYGTQISGLQNQLAGRGPFQYDVNGDALYQQMAQRYMQQGNTAMRDTMGQAAGLTGGYGSSYGQAVGQQQYNAYLQGIADNLPQYYNMAMNAYAMQGDEMRNNLAMWQQQENQDYGRWQDQYNLYNNELNRLESTYNTERNWDRGLYDQDNNFNRNAYESDRNFDYAVQKDQQALAQTQVEWYLENGMLPPEDLLAASGMSPQYAMDYLSTKAGGGGGGYGSGSGTSLGAAKAAYYLSQLQQAGKTETEMRYYLESAIADGTITRQESEQLSANNYYKPNANIAETSAPKNTADNSFAADLGAQYRGETTKMPESPTQQSAKTMLEKLKNR